MDEKNEKHIPHIIFIAICCIGILAWVIAMQMLPLDASHKTGITVILCLVVMRFIVKRLISMQYECPSEDQPPQKP